MLYREMPKTKDKLSLLGFGCMRLPGGQMNANEKESIKQIRYAIEALSADSHRGIHRHNRLQDF